MTQNDSGEPAVWTESQKQRVRAQLTKVLDCPHFHSSKRCSMFLRFIVEHAVENRLDYLKERTLGIAVFERDPEYDTNQDPVVRSTAGEVRKRLAQYYTDPGNGEEIRISLPPGSYIPEIHFPPKEQQAAKPCAPASASRLLKKKLWIPAVTVAALVIAFIAYNSLDLGRNDLDRFWDPVVRSPGPVIVCMGQPRAYGFLAQRQGEVETWFEHRNENQGAPPEPKAIPLEDIVPIWDRYIDLLDAQGYQRMARLLYGKGRDVQLRGDRSISLSELRGRPVVLIGAFNNEWTLGLTGELRFCFQADPVTHAEAVRDRQNPQKSDWRVVGGWPYWKIPADYAIVSRVRNPTTEKTVVIAAGITHFGTRAAAEMLTDETYFRAALRKAPKDWERKNMQFVLSVKVMSGAGGPPEVLDTYFW